jgi:hypothetical protein
LRDGPSRRLTQHLAAMLQDVDAYLAKGDVREAYRLFVAVRASIAWEEKKNAAENA